MPRASVHIAVLLGALLGLCGAASNGGSAIYLCDPMSARWGCTSFDPPSPPNTNCVMKDKADRIMYWAQAPARSAHYALRSADGPGPAADDPTTYVAGDFMSIHLRVLKTGMKYRGLLLNAVNGAGAVVGEFRNPAGALGAHSYNVGNPSCPGSLLHADADRKPYHAVFTFLAPPAGTGRITFRALLKRGWANTGHFHWPQKDLVLDEAKAKAPPAPGAPAAASWHVSDDGQSCATLCASKAEATGGGVGRFCDAPAMAAAAASAAGLVAAAGHMLPVFLPVVADCSPLSPATRASDDQSFYHGGGQCPSPDGLPSCEAYKAGVRRFCMCSATEYVTDAPTAAPTAAPTSAPTVAPSAPPTAAPSDPRCQRGVGANGVCCLASCGRCGGSGCNALPGGSAGCCGGTVKAAALSCDEHEAPCVLTGGGRRQLGSGMSRRRRQIADDDDDSRLYGDRPSSATDAARPALPMSLAVLGCARLLGGRVTAPLLLVLTALVVAPRGAGAHNWMPTPGRAWSTTSTAKPCLARKPTDTHQQVGKGQSFTMGFQTGHGGRHYIFVLHEDDERWLAHPKLLDFAEAYIRGAPAGNNSALSAEHKRYHGTKIETSQAQMKEYDDDLAGKKTAADQSTFPCLYERIVPQKVCADGTACADGAAGAKCADGTACANNPDFLHHKRHQFVRKEDGGKKRSFGRLFEYRAEALAAARDKRVSYASAEFPWLEAVHSYQNLANIGSDFDLLRATIPGRKGSGHYIVHWRWKGYRDCVDVDYFADRQIANVDGQSGEGVVWNKIEHCQFEKPLKVLTPCRAVAKTAKQCINDLLNAKGTGMLNREEFRAGVNIVPLKMPAAVTLADRSVGAPFHEPACVENNPLTTLTGADGFASPGDAGGWAGWRTSARVREVAGKACKEPLFANYNGSPRVFSLTLRDAVLSCTDRRCKGFAWKQGAKGPLFDAQPNNSKYDVMFCKTGSLADDAAWSAVLKDGTALAAALSLAALQASLPFAPSDAGVAFAGATMVSFEPKGADTSASVPAGFTPGSNFFVDHGAAYGARGNGQLYGWNCDDVVVANGYKPPKTPTVSSTLVEMKLKCNAKSGAALPDRRRARFSFAVPNGVYNVVTYHGADSADRHIESKHRGCTVENTRMPISGDRTTKSRGAYEGAAGTKCADGGVCGAAFGPMVVVVRDGQLDISSQLGATSSCASMSWVRFKRLGAEGPGTEAAPAAVPSAWHTGAKRAWWHRKLSEAGAPVGIVIVTPPAGANGGTVRNSYRVDGRPTNSIVNTVRRRQGDKGTAYTDLGKNGFPAWSCRSRWLFAGDDCADLGLELGVFDPDAAGGGDVGYEVTVSDQPCSGTAGCPATANTTVCKPLRSEPYEPSYCGNDYELCPLVHDCGGAVGDYVRVALRGERRIFDANVDVNRAAVAGVRSSDEMVCWGVEGRPEETLPVPKNEYYVTDDPEDAVFYSTCYFKRNDWVWEPTGREQRPTAAPWKYQGRCIRCDDFRQSGSSKKVEFPLWHLDPSCQDCDAGAVALKGYAEHGPIPATGPLPTPLPTSSPTSSPTPNPTPYVVGDNAADVRAREAREAAIAAALARGATQAEAEREGDAAAAAARAAAEADENAAGGGVSQPPVGGGGTVVVAGVGVAVMLVIGALALAVRRRRRGGERGVADGATKPPMAAEADAGDTGPMQATKIFLGPANGQNPMWRNQQQPAGAPTTSSRFAALGAAGTSAKKEGSAAGSSIQLLSPKSFVALPAGWNEELDEASGKSYWWHTASGETTWDRPK